MAIPAYYSLIQRGSSGPDVALVQTWLNGIRDSCTWHAALTVDGKFGANAEKAVREFQLRYGLKEDGKVGANTWNVLYARYTAKHGLTVPYPGIVLRSGSVGGVDSIDVSLFEGFDYVALGHLHSPQKVGRDTVRYAGSPLKYSFSEAHQHKAALFVTLGEKGSVRFEAAPLTPRHDLRELRGSYMELTDRRAYDGTPTDDYLHITLTDEQDVPDALARLRVIYPNLMRLDYDNRRTRAAETPDAAARAESKTPLEHFAAFYEAQNGQPLSDEQAAFCQSLIEDIWKEDEA